MSGDNMYTFTTKDNHVVRLGGLVVTSGFGGWIVGKPSAEWFQGHLKKQILGAKNIGCFATYDPKEWYFINQEPASKDGGLYVVLAELESSPVPECDWRHLPGQNQAEPKDHSHGTMAAIAML